MARSENDRRRVANLSAGRDMQKWRDGQTHFWVILA